MKVLITRKELYVAALGSLLLVAIHLGTQPAWAGETPAASPSPWKSTQADEPLPVAQLSDRPPTARIQIMFSCPCASFSDSDFS